MIPGTGFGLDYPYETNYRELSRRFQADGGDNWVLMPPIPFNPLENDLRKDEYPPFAPSFKDRHFLGTDTSARDMAARLVYGFRIAIFFSLTLLIVNYGVGVTVGCAMGYWGGKFDLFLQRIIEIWSNIPVSVCHHHHFIDRGSELFPADPHHGVFRMDQPDLDPSHRDL